MKEHTLTEFLKTHTQSETAKLLGRTQGAVHQMVLNGRDVRIREYPDGTFDAYEIKPFLRVAQ